MSDTVAFLASELHALLQSIAGAAGAGARSRAGERSIVRARRVEVPRPCDPFGVAHFSQRREGVLSVQVSRARGLGTDMDIGDLTELASKCGYRAPERARALVRAC